MEAERHNNSSFTDTISRQAAIDLCDWYDNPSMREDLEKLPSAQPEVKEGQWIRRDSGFDAECKCSVCGYRDFVPQNDTYWFNRNYCPNCGAKMYSPSRYIRCREGEKSRTDWLMNRSMKVE